MHGKLYIKLMNSKQWKQLRARKLAANPLCELHQKEGKVVAASVVHHIVEVESGHTEGECRALAFSWSNLQSLCRECHAAIHKAEHSHSKDAHRKREQDRLQQWKSRLAEPRDGSSNPRGPFLSGGGLHSEIHLPQSHLTG